MTLVSRIFGIVGGTALAIAALTMPSVGTAEINSPFGNAGTKAFGGFNINTPVGNAGVNTPVGGFGMNTPVGNIPFGGGFGVDAALGRPTTVAFGGFNLPVPNGGFKPTFNTLGMNTPVGNIPFGSGFGMNTPVGNIPFGGGFGMNTPVGNIPFGGGFGMNTPVGNIPFGGGFNLPGMQRQAMQMQQGANAAQQSGVTCAFGKETLMAASVNSCENAGGRVNPAQVSYTVQCNLGGSVVMTPTKATCSRVNGQVAQ